MKALLVVALVLAPSCALLEPTGSGREIVVDMATGETRPETKADAVVTAVQTVGGVVRPETAPALAVVGIGATALIGAIAALRKAAG